MTNCFHKVFLRHVQRTLPREDIKLLLGDNLAAHLSPYVTSLCEENNIRLVLYQYRYCTVPKVPYRILWQYTVPVPVRYRTRLPYRYRIVRTRCVYLIPGRPKYSALRWADSFFDKICFIGLSVWKSFCFRRFHRSFT
jgi:hypothetical protein